MSVHGSKGSRGNRQLLRRTWTTIIWKHIMLSQCHVPLHLSSRWSHNSGMAGPAGTKWRQTTQRLLCGDILTPTMHVWWSWMQLVLKTCHGHSGFLGWVIHRSCTQPLLPWLSMDWSHDYHVVITWLNGADHVTDHALIMFAIIHWSCASGGTWTVHDQFCDQCMISHVTSTW